MSDILDRLWVLHEALKAGSIPHAFGGALALAYCVAEPRGTRDIDVNIFIPTDRATDVFNALPDDILVGDKDRRNVERDDQVRLWWDEVPVDLFFACDPFHFEVAQRVHEVEVLPGRLAPMLDCGSLAVFKVMFNRTKDWGDLEAMIEVGWLDFDWALGWLHRLIGPQDEATIRFSELRPLLGTVTHLDP